MSPDQGSDKAGVLSDFPEDIGSLTATEQDSIGAIEQDSIEDWNANFDVASLETPDLGFPVAALASEDAEQDEEQTDEGAGATMPPPAFDPEAVRARIEELVRQNSTPTRAGRGQIVSLGALRPQHFSAADLKAAADKPIDWVFKSLWTKKSKVLLASEPKAGKTWLVCAFAISMATGDPLFEAIEVLDPGPVGIIAAEDEEGEIGRRFDRMCRAQGRIMSDLDIHWWPGETIRLNRPRDVDWIEEQVQKYGIKLMIYDPLARLMDGDENSKECVSGVLTPASEMVRNVGCSVMLVHHLGKDDPDRPKTAAQRVRGSSDIRSWYTTGLFISGQLDQGRINIELEQRVRGRLPTDFPVRAVEVEEQSAYGLGTLKLVANIAKDRGEDGNNEQLVEQAARKILDLAKMKSSVGLSISEIGVHLRLGRTLVNAALKKLIREDGVLEFEMAGDIPDGKVLVLTSGASRAVRAASAPAAVQRPAKASKSRKKAAAVAQPDPEPEPQQQGDEDTLFG